MLKVRVIPTLLWKDLGLVKGVGFDSWRRVGPVLPAIKVYNARDVDELVLLDIAATTSQRPPDVEGIQDYADDCFVPLTVGGGVHGMEDIHGLLAAGADKVCLNSSLYGSLDLLSSGAKRFGAQCMVASVDVRQLAPGEWRCFSHGGTRLQAQLLLDWVRALVDHGAGEILLTSIDRDGTMSGYDLPLIEQVVAAVNVPVIASGGAGCYEHMRQAVQEAGASAVAAASIFHFTEQTPAEAKRYLADAGIPVRSSFGGG